MPDITPQRGRSAPPASSSNHGIYPFDALRCPRCGAMLHNTEAWSGFNLRVCEGKTRSGATEARCAARLLITADGSGLALVTTITDAERPALQAAIDRQHRKAS